MSPTSCCHRLAAWPVCTPLPTPTCHDGVTKVMLTMPDKSRQPSWAAWSHEQLICECVIALSYALDNSALITYNSHLQSYLSFCKLHSLPLDPTPNTLSFYIVFMSHHIKLVSVMQYLSGIINSLKPHFPHIRKNHHNILVTQTLTGMRKLQGFIGTHHKCALTEDDLLSLLDHFTSGNLDDMLFIAIVFSLFHTLLQLRETTQPDSASKHSFWKVTLRHSVKLTRSTFSFILPMHKADHFFESSMILIQSLPGRLCPWQPFMDYLTARNTHFPFHAQLWLWSTGEVPTYSWVVSKLKIVLGSNVASHSLCSGGGEQNS